MVIEERMKDTKQELADHISNIISTNGDIVKVFVLVGGKEIKFDLDSWEIARYLVSLFTITSSNKIFVDFRTKCGVGWIYRYHGSLNKLTSLSSYHMKTLQSEVNTSVSFNRKDINFRQAGPLNNVRLRSRKKW